MFLTINQKFLQFFYNALLTGMPSLTYNPINKNTLHAPFNVNEGSTYINYKLNTHQIKSIQNYLSEKGNLKIVPTKLFKNDKKNDFYLSINIYNCSSPIFNFLRSRIFCPSFLYLDRNSPLSPLLISVINPLKISLFSQ